MAFYIRKSVKVGAFRFNLSKSGVGMSVGVKGFRLGSGPRGNYVHVGRNGLYYRHTLSPSRKAIRPAAPKPAYRASLDPTLGPVQLEERGDVSEMQPSALQDILDEINRKLSALPLWPLVIVAGLIGAFLLHTNPKLDGVAAILFLITPALTVLAWIKDRTRRTVAIVYDLDDQVVAAFERLAAELAKMFSCKKAWSIATSQAVLDRKRNAGAGRQIARALARLPTGAPKRIKTNVNPPCISGGRQSIYFFPDIALVVEGKRAGAISYDDLRLEFGQVVFIESDPVPRDAQVVGHTWRFVNKNGGPDRRFNNNRQIPQVLYQTATLAGPGGFQKLLHLSHATDPSSMLSALAGVRDVVRQMNAITPAGPPSGLKAADLLPSA